MSRLHPDVRGDAPHLCGSRHLGGGRSGLHKGWIHVGGQGLKLVKHGLNTVLCCPFLSPHPLWATHPLCAAMSFDMESPVLRRWPPHTCSWRPFSAGAAMPDNLAAYHML